jgi:hypothetical protein
LNNSDKVALNLKLKGKKNIWFGNVTLGAGIVKNRWKEFEFRLMERNKAILFG